MFYNYNEEENAKKNNNQEPKRALAGQAQDQAPKLEC